MKPTVDTEVLLNYLRDGLDTLKYQLKLETSESLSVIYAYIIKDDKKILYVCISSWSANLSGTADRFLNSTDDIDHLIDEYKKEADKERIK